VALNKEKVMDAARKFVDKGQIDKAVKEYLRIVNEDPKDVRIWLKIGDLYAKKGAKQEATDTYLKVARFYHEQGFFLKAVAVYNQILKLDPRLVDVILKLAELYRELGRMSEAMQHYESVAAHFHREGNTKEALETVKKLVDLDPENIATRIKLAELYSKEGLVQDAIEQFTNACEQLRRQNRQDDFVKVAERLLWHQPENHGLMRELAGLYLRRNDPRRALQKLQACFKADPRDVETLGLLALAFQALDQKAKTVSVLKELARIHVENKARDKAKEVYLKILEIVPNDPDALGFVGTMPAPLAAQPPPRPPAMPPQMRQSTPIPAEIRAATSNAKFNITSDLQAIPPSSRMTGSMPLVDEQSLSGVDFALPEYDDPDFQSDMEPPPDPRRMSANGERHAEEISKVLAETDVYVKYGLHQKAVDHLRRVFTLDDANVEAHERLKDIFISQGREQEAEVELLKLAELIAPTDPDRAEQYLQELLAMNGTHTGAFELARRFRLRVARMSSVSSEVEYAGGGVAEIGDDGELELAPPPSAMGIARGGHHRDSIDEFDPNDLIGHDLAHGSPAPSRVPQRDSEFELEFEPHQSSTRQVPPEQIEQLARMPEEYDEDVLGGQPAVAPWNGAEAEATSFEGGIYDASLDDAVEAQLDDDALSEDIDHQVAAEMGQQGDEDLPFDPADARAFDAGVGGGPSSYDQDQTGAAAYDEADPMSISGSYDPYGTESVQTPPYDATAMNAAMVPADHGETDTPIGERAESLVEDDLDEADFYAGQGMYDEALESLRSLLERFPNHRLIVAKMHEVEAMMGGHDMALETPPAGNDAHIPVQVDAVDDGPHTDALDLDEIEEVSADDMLELDESGAHPKGRKPSVMLEKPVDEGDAETHYDLGLAYKEMGLFDEAIKAFEKVLRSPGREVECRVMIGMCHREQGNPSEAIHEFKQGLHANGTDRERLSLYYEIGVTYESIGDEGEALYYFEAVLKRDAHFADAAQRAEDLRARVGHSTPPADEDI
jgi:tetratricopeptide (TPR) repeat protein